MIKNFLIITISLFVFFDTSYSQVFSGTTAAQFLKIEVGAKSIGMGGAFVSLANDASALYWNPAGIGKLGTGINVGATYTRWFGGITDNFLGVVIPVSDKYRLGLSMTLVDYGDLRTATIQQDVNGGTFNANDLAIGLTFAGALTDRFS